MRRRRRTYAEVHVDRGPSQRNTPRTVDRAEVDLGSWRFWRGDDDFRDGAFATLRHRDPISFHRPVTAEGVDAGAGHWALTRYDDVHYASRHPEIFSSSPNITIGDQTRNWPSTSAP